ncbi:MAG: hypothetical protein AAGA70_03595 [Pseudomonadota bacterium]
MAQHSDLTGEWWGIYRYPTGGAQPVPMEVKLSEAAGELSGESREPNTFRKDLGPELRAELNGHRDGSAVQFSKRYLGFTQPGGDPVYAGTSDAARTQIRGHWHFRRMPHWGGTFSLRRKPHATATATRRIEEAVDL